MKRYATFLVGTFFALLVASCSPPPAKDKEPVRIPATDTQPIGDGLRVIGYSLLGAAVVLTAGRAFR